MRGTKAITDRRERESRSMIVTRRSILGTGLAAGGGLLLPGWARSASAGNRGITEIAASEFDLAVGHSGIDIGGRAGHAITVNGTLPAPLLRFREGERIVLRVRNELEEDTSNSLAWPARAVSHGRRAGRLFPRHQAGRDLHLRIRRPAERHLLVPFAFGSAGADGPLRTAHRRSRLRRPGSFRPRICSRSFRLVVHARAQTVREAEEAQ